MMRATSDGPSVTVPDGVLLSLVDELASEGRYAESTLSVLNDVVSRFEHFCASHGVSALPASETTLLAFLESQRPGLAWSYAKAQLRMIKVSHVLAGLPQPSSLLTRGYLQALQRDPASPQEQRKVSALTEEEVERMVGQLAASMTLAGSEHPVRAQVLRAVAGYARAGTPDWATVAPLVATSAAGCATPDDVKALGANLRAGLRGAGRRAGLDVRTLADVEALTESEYHLLLSYCDEAHARNLRDWTYVVLGISGGLRHISLAHLDIADVRKVDDGYVAVFRRAKLPAGQVLTKHFRHLDGQPQTCADALCPACAIERQLDACRRQGRTSGPLLATYYGGSWRAMTRQNGRFRILSAYGDLGESEQRRIATRSFRSTAATWAFKAGLTIAEIAEFVTNHRDTATCYIYIRPDGNEAPVGPRYA